MTQYNYHPFSLRLFSPILVSPQAFMYNLGPVALDWRRSIRAIGGYWLGSFSLVADNKTLFDDDLQAAFDTWLACHVQESVGGLTSWEGLIYEMDLTRDGVQRRRSLDLIYNRMRSTFTKFDWTGELIDNGGFEVVSGADFDGWYEGSGVADGAPTVYAGSHSCQITSDGVTETLDGGTHMTNTWIRQNVSVVAGDKYKLNLMCYGRARVGIRNPNSPTSWLLVPGVLNLANAWGGRTFYFTGPVGSEVLIYLYPGTDAGNIGIFDSVSVQERGEVVAETDWTENEDSAGRYGVREGVLHLDDYPLESSEARRDSYLAGNAQPYARPVAAGKQGQTRLDITVAGYVHTANWMFVREGDGEEDDLSAWLAAIAGSDFGRGQLHGGESTTAGDLQFLKAGNIAENTLQVVTKSTLEQRGWDQISELVTLGIDDTANSDTPDFMPCRAWVGPGRLLHYGMVDRTPRYFLRHGGIVDSLSQRGTVSPWTIQPAVIRDQSYPNKRDLSGSFLEDARDLWAEEVEVSADGGILFKTSLWGDTDDALAQRMDYFGGGNIVDPLNTSPGPAPPFKIIGLP